MSKERPIIFSAPMVRAILEWRKSQTRRIVKPQPVGILQCSDEVFRYADVETKWHTGPWRRGLRVWVRESFAHEPADYCWEASVSIPCSPSVTVYRADADTTCAARGIGWTPSIFMPRKLSRIDLQITDVRVERLQDISEDDARAEGIVSRRISTGDARTGCRNTFGLACDDSAWAVDARQAYQHVWESINGLGSWDANPLVWVIQFARVEHGN